MPLTRTSGFDLMLDGRQSIDFDNIEDENFEYEWSCKELVQDQDCFNLDTQQYYFKNNASLTIPSYEFSIGLYEFTLTISKPSGLPTTTSQRVYTNGVGPIVFAEVRIYYTTTTMV
jgi:hypothetical protein